MTTTYVIGEIGQNHNGSTDIAKLLVELVRRPVEDELFALRLRPIDAVKLTKRDLAQELSADAMQRPYSSPHSFGRTYGEHRAYLELSDAQHHEVYEYAKSMGLEFVETLCAIGCLSVLRLFTPDRLKVASRDLTNIPLLKALAETRIPLILSTGMAGKEELDRALDVITPYHGNVAILHCVSEYPTRPEHVNLLTIPYLLKAYPGYTIGYSDHTIGIAAPVAAVALGARVIEKHVTIDRRMKGTDQAGSLGPDGVQRMVRDIRLMEMSLGTETLFIEPAVKEARQKLERSLASRRNIAAGELLREDDVHLLSPGDGLRWHQMSEILGHRAKVDIAANSILYPEMFT